MMVTLCCSGDGCPEEFEEDDDLAGLGLLGLEERGRGEDLRGCHSWRLRSPLLLLLLLHCVC